MIVSGVENGKVAKGTGRQTNWVDWGDGHRIKVVLPDLEVLPGGKTFCSDRGHCFPSSRESPIASLGIDSRTNKGE